MGRLGFGLAAALVAVLGCSDSAPLVNPDRCTAHADCDDGVFCNGTERCLPESEDAAPDGCVAAPPPCAATQRCDEPNAVCETDCGMETDADGDGVDAIACGGADCDDADPLRYPGAVEVCDLEHRDEDCDDSTVGARDLDGDGVTSAQCCNGNSCGADCDDNDRATHPGVIEICDEVDNDCDGATDEEVQVQRFIDRDHDGIGASGTAVAACPGTPGTSSVGGDCDDTLASVRPTAPEICDSLDNDCDGITDEDTVAIPWYVDGDGDGWGIASSAAPSVEACVPPAGRAIRQGDCDDDDAAVNPEAPERCNGRDDDCDGRADYVIAAGDSEDDDGDGVPDARCEDALADCDDTDPYRSGPGSPELCDLRDNDCDGNIDEGAVPVLWYADIDGDGFGDASDSLSSCPPLPGRVRDATDCDDRNPATRPDAADACAGQVNVDDDCDGSTDEGAEASVFYIDSDGDSYGVGEPISSCQFDVGVALRAGDCDDTNPLVNPGAFDDCAGIAGVDDNCNGATDEDPNERTFFVDDDGDGFGAGAPSSGCTVPANAVSNNLDCDDSDAFRNPMRLDDCGGIPGLDDDCDGVPDDEEVPVTYFRDVDGDGFGAPGDTEVACAMPAGYVALATDCDDAAMSTFPGADERCDDGIDNDCDGDVDCDDSDCTLGCVASIEVTAPITDPAFPYALFASELGARVLDQAGEPMEGVQVTLDLGTLVAEAGRVRTTDAAGQVSFPIRAGLIVGEVTISLRAPGVPTATTTVTVGEPPAGYSFTLLNAERQALPTPLPEEARFVGGTLRVTKPAASPAGDLYIGWDSVLYRLSREGRVEHFAGLSGGAALADGVDATTAALDLPELSPLAWDQTAGRLLVLVEGPRRLFAIDPDTRVASLVAGGGATHPNSVPAGTTIAVDEIDLRSFGKDVTVTPNGVVWIVSDERLYWLDEGAGLLHAVRVVDKFGYGSLAPVPDGSDDVYLLDNVSVLRLRQNGTSIPVAGGGSEAADDGPALDASFTNEFFLHLDGTSVVAVETTRHRLRRFTEGGAITTIAGTLDMAGFAGDEGPASSTLLTAPGGAATWRGHLVFTDQRVFNQPATIRVIW